MTDEAEDWFHLHGATHECLILSANNLTGQDTKGSNGGR